MAYIKMIETAIILSLKITAIYMLFQEGMIFGRFRIGTANLFDWLFGLTKSRYIQKPIWDCLTCMASGWTIILTCKIDIGLILVVCGLNSIVDKFFQYAEDFGR